MKNKIIAMIRTVLGIDDNMSNEEIEKSDLLVLGIDSISAIQLIIMLESELSIEFEDTDLNLSTVKTVDSIMTTLSKYIQEK